ncbi:MAG: type I-G CRISPR-associated protein Csb2 [Acidimicrobiales bacterium]
MLGLTIRLRLGAYDAAAIDDPLSPEWPPHPARVFCALVAGGPTDAEWAALRWLEAQALPEVHAPAELSRLSPEQFLVTNNRAESGGGSQTHPGRKHMTRVKPRLLPRRRVFRVVWPSAQPTDADLAALASLARRVPYVGRVTSDAEVTVSDHVEPDDGLAIYEAIALRDAEVDLRVPYPGYCDWLAAAFEEDRHAWEESRRAGYRVRPITADPSDDVIPSPYAALLVLGIEGTSRLAASHTAAITNQLHRAAIGLVEAELGAAPTAVSGHDGEEPHVAYLTLPNVGTPPHLPGTGQRFVARNPHADGRVLGVALAIPRDSGVTEADLHRCLVAPQQGTGLDHLVLGRLGKIGLLHDHGGRRAEGLAAARWTRPARWWATATPLVLDRFPKPGRDDVGALVADALVTAGYPRPVDVRVSRTAFLPGAPVLGRSAVQRRAGMPVRPWCHAWVRFPEAVAGPVIAGSMRFRGVGLFAPLATSEAVA